jgi:uncharacterized protein YgiM (DUF1202 family)
LKNFGTLNLYIMKTMKTKTKYQDGGANGTKGQGKLGPALGIGTTVSSAAALITKMIADKVKAKKEAKAEEEKKKAAEAAKKMTMQKMGGTTKYKMGGAKKYQPGGPTTPPAGPRDPMSAPGVSSPTGPYSTSTPTMGGTSLTPAEVAALNKKAAIDKRMGRSKYGGAKKYMTGGMVNSNAKVSALKSAGSNGVKSGVNPKAKASTTTKGKTGGTSKAPTKATPTKNKRK